MYEAIKQFLSEGGKCLLIENGKPIGVILTIEEYEILRGKLQITNDKSQTETEQLLTFETNSKPIASFENPIGEAIAKEMDFSEASANIDEINLADAESVTLEDLGLDELPY